MSKIKSKSTKKSTTSDIKLPKGKYVILHNKPSTTKSIDEIIQQRV